MIRKNLRCMAAVLLAANLATLRLARYSQAAMATATEKEYGGTTTTPIKHLVVIFQENVSFDHYFGDLPGCRESERRD